MAKLTITDEQGKERVHELVDAVTSIGRSSSNTIQVSDEKASRQHFRVEKDGDRFKVVDLGSTNGVRLNGVKVKDSVVLCNGDMLSFGKTTFKYEGPGEPVKTPEAPSTIVIPPGTPSSAPSSALKPEPLKIDAQADAPKYVLRVLEGNAPGKIYELGASAFTLGRHASNTIQISDDAASNYHAEVTREPMGYVVTDLGSTNGTRVKAKGKTDFEKIVKTPLSSGMQIRVGKTVLEFENIGKPEEDQLFSTIALDPEKLGDKLEEPRRGGRGKLIAALVVVFLGALAVVVALAPGGDSGGTSKKSGEPVAPVPAADATNRIANGDFGEGTDDEGNPRQFRIERGAPGVKVAVSAEADRGGGTPVPAPLPVASDPAKTAPPPPDRKLGLQVVKSGKSGAALTAVETAATFSIDAGKVYELSGWMKNDGDGLFGLRVTWLAGERKLTEHPVVLKDTQEWKEKSATLTPPPWAQRARAGIFVQGKDGKASFDDLLFRERSDAMPTAAQAVKFGAVALHFEGSKGVFTGSLLGETVIEDGTLLLRGPENQSIDLTSAVDPRAKSEGAGASVDGRIYDFAIQELTEYRIEATPGSSGVNLRAAVNTPHEQGCKPELRFYVAGAVSQGDVEITKSGAVQRMTAADAAQANSAVDELLFNAGRTPQLNVAFARPVDVEIRREGNRRAVTISFRGELELAVAPESQAQKKQMLTLIEALQSSVNVKRWGDAEAKLAQLKQQYKARFPQAAEEANKAEGSIEKAWKNAQDEVARAMDNVKQLKTTASGNLARDTITRHATEWTGSDRAGQLSANLPLVADLLKEGDAEKAEKEAEKLYAQAEDLYNKKAYAVASSILRLRILNDKTMKEFKIAAKAQELVDKCEVGQRRQRELALIEEKLRDKVKNYLLTNDYKSAVDAVEKDKEFQDNRTDLPIVNQMLEDWKRKAK